MCAEASQKPLRHTSPFLLISLRVYRYQYHTFPLRTLCLSSQTWVEKKKVIVSHRRDFLAHSPNFSLIKEYLISLSGTDIFHSCAMNVLLWVALHGIQAEAALATWLMSNGHRFPRVPCVTSLSCVNVPKHYKRWSLWNIECTLRYSALIPFFNLLLYLFIYFYKRKKGFMTEFVVCWLCWKYTAQVGFLF